MDLKKVRQIEYNFDVVLTDQDLRILEIVGMLYSPSSYFPDSKTYVDVCYSGHTDLICIHIGNSNEEEDRTFYEFNAKGFASKIYENKFWGHGVIHLETMESIRERKNPRTININIKGGIYDGYGTEDMWMNVFIAVEDFTPVAFPATFHSQAMDNLLEKGNFADINIFCKDGRVLKAHKCLLIACPYFMALLSNRFERSNENLAKVEFDLAPMRVVLQYLYSGRISEDSVRNWAELFEVASFFCLDILARHCELQMMTRASNDVNEIRMLIKFALRFHARKLSVYLTNLVRKIQKDSCSKQ